MKSPWQLIKSLTSRRKVEEASEPVDEVALRPDPRGQEVAQDRARQAGLIATPESVSAFRADSNQPIEQSNPPGAEADEPDPVVLKDSLLSEHVSDEAAAPHDQPSPAAPIVQAIKQEPSASASARNLKEHHTNTVQVLVQKDVTKPTVVKKAAQLPEAARKTFLEETIELDREINDLRSQLSAKLLQQNRQLRRMLERYNDK